MDPIAQAIYFGKVDEFIKQEDPNKEEQIPATQDDAAYAKHAYEQNPTEANGKTYVRALRQCGHHAEADAFAKAHLKEKPKFTIEGY